MHTRRERAAGGRKERSLNNTVILHVQRWLGNAFGLDMGCQLLNSFPSATCTLATLELIN